MTSNPAELNALPPISANDRIVFALFLAVVLHLVLILGIVFESPEPKSAPSTLEVVLAQFSSEEAPEEADYLAQANQVGSGSSEEKAKPTTDQLAPFEDQRMNQVNPAPQSAQQLQPQDSTQRSLSSTADSNQQVYLTPTSPEDRQVKVSKEEMLDNLNRQIEIASYEAALEQQRKAYAKRPRKRVLTSASTKAAHDAAYLNNWRLTIESIGNLNYPAEATQRDIYGNLRLLVSINADGSLRSMKLLKSSGHRLLDQAAMHIVELAAPFEPFPPEIKRNTDILEIIRTWRFEKGSLSSY